MLNLLTTGTSPNPEHRKGNGDEFTKRNSQPYFHQPLRLNRCLALLNSSLPHLKAPAKGRKRALSECSLPPPPRHT
jgi:hypothetical protein